MAGPRDCSDCYNVAVAGYGSYVAAAAEHGDGGGFGGGDIERVDPELYHDLVFDLDPPGSESLGYSYGIVVGSVVLCCILELDQASARIGVHARVNL